MPIQGSSPTQFWPVFFQCCTHQPRRARCYFSLLHTKKRAVPGVHFPISALGSVSLGYILFLPLFSGDKHLTTADFAAELLNLEGFIFMYITAL